MKWSVIGEKRQKKKKKLIVQNEEQTVESVLLEISGKPRHLLLCEWELIFQASQKKRKLSGEGKKNGTKRAKMDEEVDK